MPLDSLQPAFPAPLPRPVHVSIAAAAPAGAEADESLLALGRWLRDQLYHFVCPTPETHARVLERSPGREASSLAEVFGWNLPFRADLLPSCVTRWLREAGALSRIGGRLRSGVRFASAGTRLFVHSSFPTLERDAVFFGPDTYRFARFVDGVLAEPWPWNVRSLVDIGCGSGAGAILAMRALDARVLRRVVLRDVNARALRYAATNVALNGAGPCEFSDGDSLSEIEGPFDLIIANPPYMIDEHLHRSYCDGGGSLGVHLALRFLSDALVHLAPGGRIVVYTGAPVMRGEDVFFRQASELLDRARLRYHYCEIDPDVFGEALSQPAYAQIDRIAAVGLVVSRAGGDR